MIFVSFQGMRWFSSFYGELNDESLPENVNDVFGLGCKGCYQVVPLPPTLVLGEGVAERRKGAKPNAVIFIVFFSIMAQMHNFTVGAYCIRPCDINSNTERKLCSFGAYAIRPYNGYL